MRWAAPVGASFTVASVCLVPWSFSASGWVFLATLVRIVEDAELRVALERVADGDEVDPEILDRLSRRAS